MSKVTNVDLYFTIRFHYTEKEQLCVCVVCCVNSNEVKSVYALLYS